MSAATVWAGECRAAAMNRDAVREGYLDETRVLLEQVARFLEDIDSDYMQVENLLRYNEQLVEMNRSLKLENFRATEFRRVLKEILE